MGLFDKLFGKKNDMLYAPVTGEAVAISQVSDPTFGEEILEGLGGKDNIASADHCITRLRMEVKDRLLVDENKIKSSGVSGVIRPGKTSVQVIVGPKVQFVFDELKKLI